MPYCNANMAGGKILKGLQNRRIDELIDKIEY